VASADRLTRLKNIRDNAEKALEDWLAQCAALTAAGAPPPSTYSMGGRSFSWASFGEQQMAFIAKVNEMINAEEVPEARVRMWG
jgi:hypothetical protein